MLKSILYTIAITIFSALLVVYAVDVSKGIEIEEAGTRAGQGTLVFLATFLGVKGSIAVGVLATGLSLWHTIHKYRKRKNGPRLQRYKMG